ncbi:MAG: Copper resistance protein CopC [Candidatus Levybacteria bacterium]|nr:Copper resistance protein CopC [Candidatus Levybacteria bacterium]
MNRSLLKGFTRCKTAPGFTLIELIITIAVLGVLAAAVLIAINPAQKIAAARLATIEAFDATIKHSLIFDLVGEWTFDDAGAGTAKDTSGYGNHATSVTATSALDRKGQANKAYSFNGTNITVPDNVSLKPTSAITISAWIKPNNTLRGGIVDTFSGGFRGYDMFVLNGRSYFYLAISGNSNDQSFQGIVTGVWQLITWSYDGASEKGYLNGTQMISAAKSGTILYDTTPLKIGLENYWLNNFNGSIDDVRIYKSALLSSQIKQLYAQGLIKHLLAFKY